MLALAPIIIKETRAARVATRSPFPACWRGPPKRPREMVPGACANPQRNAALGRTNALSRPAQLVDSGESRNEFGNHCDAVLSPPRLSIRRGLFARRAVRRLPASSMTFDENGKRARGRGG